MSEDSASFSQLSAEEQKEFEEFVKQRRIKKEQGIAPKSESDTLPPAAASVQAASAPLGVPEALSPTPPSGINDTFGIFRTSGGTSS